MTLLQMAVILFIFHRALRVPKKPIGEIQRFIQPRGRVR